MRPRSPRRLAVLGTAALLTITACSGDEPTATPTTATSTTTTSTTATSTIVTPTTETSTTATSTTTTPPPTTVETTTTISDVATSPPVDLAAAVERDWREGLRRYHLAAQAPKDEAVVAAALEYTIDAVRTGTEAFLTDLRTRNERWIPSGSVEPRQVITEGPKRDDAMPFEVEMLTCEVNPFVLVSDKADGTTEVVDDGVVTTLWTSRLRFHAGIWKLSSLVPVREWDGVTQCDP